jgi:hypothetical protein
MPLGQMSHVGQKAVLTARKRDFRGRDASYLAPTGSPEAVTRLRLPQNVACGFTAPRSSAVDSQHCQHLQFPVWETQFWFQQRSPLFDLVEGIPGEATACPAAAAQHLSPVTFDTAPGSSLQAKGGTVGSDLTGYGCIIANQRDARRSCPWGWCSRSKSPAKRAPT